MNMKFCSIIPGRTPSLELLLPEKKSISLTEAPVRIDKDSASPAAFPAFHGFGVSGTATGQIVYANYGRPEDFAALEKAGDRPRRARSFWCATASSSAA